MTAAHEKLLNSVPDFTSWDEAALWLEEGMRIAAEFNPQVVLKAPFLTLEWSDISEKAASRLGLYSSLKWRKFVLATFLADLISYTNPDYQVSFERLLFVMHAFPQGFRIWWIELSNHTWFPVGYTGWFPMFESMYLLFKNNPEKLKDRTVVPSTSKAINRPYLYLFNFSVISALKKSPLSNLLMKKFVHDINEQRAAGLACITVSGDGARIAMRFKMSMTGYLEGGIEGVYVR